MTEISKRIENAARVLDAYAAAIRGDWSEIDGRTERDSLNRVSAYLRGEQDDLTVIDVGVCTIDGPHWNEGPWNVYRHNGTPCMEEE